MSSQDGLVLLLDKCVEPVTWAGVQQSGSLAQETPTVPCQDGIGARLAQSSW